MSAARAEGVPGGVRWPQLAQRTRWLVALAGLLFAGVILSASSARAQIQATAEATKSGQTARTDFKVIKWALPTLADEQVLDLLGEIEYQSYRYNVDYRFAVAVIASEASFPGRIAVGRKRNIDLARIMTKSGAGGGYPAVVDDLPNALSTLATMLRTEDTTELALREYWADTSISYNTDTVSEFVKRVGEKYALLEGMSEQQAQQNYLREIQKFPAKSGEPAFSISQMPNLNKQLVKYDVEPMYAEVAQYFNSRLSEAEAALIARSVLSFSMQTDTVDPRLVMALIAAESRFNPRAVSKKGAMGLAQLMPATARSHGIRDAFDPVQNVYVCVKYLEREIRRWRGSKNWLDLVLASYNAGSGAVKKYGGVPPYAETRSFVAVVKSYYNQLRGGR